MVDEIQNSKLIVMKESVKDIQVSMLNPEFLIETERLIMRNWTLDDAENLYQLNADPEVVRYTGNDSFRDKEEVIELISTYDQYKKYKMGRWNVELKHNKEYLGWCGLKFINDDDIDLGYRFNRHHWGFGYATESSKVVLQYGFEELSLKKIVGRAAKENVRSLHVLMKIGMAYEKDFDSHGYRCEQYFITPEMWMHSKHING